MSSRFWLTDAQMARLRSFFLKSHGKPRLDDRWKRWRDRGLFARMMDGLASEAAVPKTVMIDATDLKAHRTATSLRAKTGGQATKGTVRSAGPKVA